MPANKTGVPTFDKLFNPILSALKKLGGSASNQELVDEIVVSMGLPSDIANLPHGRGSWTELGYRSAWARNYLKNYGLIENSDRGIWALSPKGAAINQVDAREVVRTVQKQHKERVSQEQSASHKEEAVESDEQTTEYDWKSQLLEILYEISPQAFERLCQRILRESGFFEVEVTGRSGDGGIDGHGTIRIGGLISFNVLFQSKRYRNNLGPDVVRDFRGAMIGRADKGLIITTGGFTRDARKEATRDGAPPIDLIDGELLVEKLKDLRLGVQVKMVESVDIQEYWFSAL